MCIIRADWLFDNRVVTSSVAKPRPTRAWAWALVHVSKIECHSISIEWCSFLWSQPHLLRSQNYSLFKTEGISNGIEIALIRTDVSKFTRGSNFTISSQKPVPRHYLWPSYATGGYSGCMAYLLSEAISIEWPERQFPCCLLSLGWGKEEETTRKLVVFIACGTKV